MITADFKIHLAPRHPTPNIDDLSSFEAIATSFELTISSFDRISPTFEATDSTAESAFRHHVHLREVRIREIAWCFHIGSGFELIISEVEPFPNSESPQSRSGAALERAQAPPSHGSKAELDGHNQFDDRMPPSYIP